MQTSRKSNVKSILIFLIFTWFHCHGFSSTLNHEERGQLYIKTLDNAKSSRIRLSQQVQVDDIALSKTWKTKDKNPQLSSYPSSIPSSSPTSAREQLVYEPGNLKVVEIGLTLSKGLQANLVAAVGYSVWYENGTMSKDKFLVMPDAAATFATSDGGWIYTINSEYRVPNQLKWSSPADNLGGVSGIRFNKAGVPIEYSILLNDTYANCGGGKTPWGTWVSCEEYPYGQIWQVDPTGQRAPEQTSIGLIHAGQFEAFAYDVRNATSPRFFVTKDDKRGELRRFTPLNPNWDDPWTILHKGGTLDYLVLVPFDDTNGRYEWTLNLDAGQQSAADFFPNSEGIDVVDNRLYFISKKLKKMFRLDLDSNTYHCESTQEGLFNGEPDQIVHITNHIVTEETQTTTSNNDKMDNCVPKPEQTMVYFTEDGGKNAGVHARDINGRFYTILESYKYRDETTGLSFSPDSKHMYVAYQKSGLLFSISRLDGQPFYGASVNLKHH